jgi:HPt (histidine-containing phosphotransfer) domain-containing protein
MISEEPNLDYIDQLARDDDAVKQMLIDVLKNEFPTEQQEYYDSLAEKDFKKLASNVHRMKPKISILGLEKNYKLANDYEHNLKNNNLEGFEGFEELLQLISSFLKTI